ncbi:class I SAM-dependent methyltransferase [Candidatus Woesearchaeota archaeon]|nr:class I SAM-dependent methyltransferase [Candidatus Woesearchaeota archaeon]
MKVPKYYRKEFESFLADIYDVFVNVMTFFQIKRLRKKAINTLGLKKGQSVLDLACGTGGLTTISAEKVGEKGKVVGIDLSQRMLNIAIKKSKQCPQISYLWHNFEHMHYKNLFDAVVVGFGAHEVPPEPRHNLYKQAYKALKPKGKLLIFDYAMIRNKPLRLFYWLYLRTIEHPNGWEYVNENHQKILKEIGFKRVKHQRFAYLFDVAMYQIKVEENGKRRN